MTRLSSRVFCLLYAAGILRDKVEIQFLDLGHHRAYSVMYANGLPVYPGLIPWNNLVIGMDFYVPVALVFLCVMVTVTAHIFAVIRTLCRPGKVKPSWS